MTVVEVFAPLFGHWQGSEELHASPWSTAGTARAILSFRADVGGTAMVNDYRQVRAGGTEFYGHGVFLVDDALVVSWWLFDSVGLPPVAATGGWRGRELVLTKRTERGVAIHRFGTDADELTYAIDLVLGPLTGGTADVDLRAAQPFLRGRYQALSTH